MANQANEDSALTVVPERQTHIPASSGSTLLPGPAASLISIATQSAAGTLNLGTIIGGVALSGVRVGTLTGLELTRSVAETILLRAGQDVTEVTADGVGKAEVEGIIGRCVGALHYTITGASLAASYGFRLTSDTISSIVSASQLVLSALDAVLGSTESSRAVAAIVTLIRTEFQNSVTGNKGERVGVTDLLWGGGAFALLQQWGRRRTERAVRDRGGEETVWDVVILDNGVRADVVGTADVEYAESVQDAIEDKPASFISTRGDGDIHAIRRHSDSRPLVPQISLLAEARSDWSEGEIRLHVMDQLPLGTHFAVRTETVSAKTITVDIFDPDHSDITAPPGTLIIEERFHHQDPDWSSRRGSVDLERVPKHTVVFQTTWNRTHDVDLKHEEDAMATIEAGPDMDRNGSSHDEVEAHPDTLSDEDIDTPLVFDHLGPTGPDSSWDTPEMKSEMKDKDDEDQTLKPSLIPIPATNAQDLSNSSPQSIANQKRPRKPASSSSSLSGSDTPIRGFGKSSFSKIAAKVKPSQGEKPEKRMPLRKALKKTLSPSQSTTSFRDMVMPGGQSNETKTSYRKPIAASTQSSKIQSRVNPSRLAQTNVTRLDKTLPRVPPTGRESPSVTRVSGSHFENPRSSSRTSFYSIHEKQRDSVITQTETYSLHSVETRAGSPTFNRTHFRTGSGLARTRSEKDITLQPGTLERPGSSSSNHRRSKSFVPSIYSVATTSQTSLVLAPRPRKSVFEDRKTILSLNRDGRVPGMFPRNHLAYNVGRFARFSSASYGSQFMHYMGIASKAARNQKSPQDLLRHHEHHSFSTHTGLPSKAILLSPFEDPSGGSNAAGETSSGVPLVYYLSLDHESKAVVLTFRGTLGFEDVLTDMTCDYDELQWQGKRYKVHKGMHASARRLLTVGQLMATIKASLEEYPEWGLVLCGHSLGGGIAALLAILISEPSVGNVEESGSSFVTKNSSARLLTNGMNGTSQSQHSILPPRRPIQVYAYGPPATLSESLRVATRGLITTIVNGEDIIPCLSLGVLRDFQSVALEFKTDDTGAGREVWTRLKTGFGSFIRNKLYVHQPPLDFSNDPSSEDDWAWAALKTLRACMRADKLLPPGEVFVVETMPVLRRHAFMSDPGDGSGLGRPATRVQMKWVRDVEERFGEIRFGSSMLTDHSPGRYEVSLAALARGVLDD